MTQTKDLTDFEKSQRVSQSVNEEDGTSTEAAWMIAEALGVRTDATQRVVDTYGPEHALAALADVRRQLDAGKPLRNPFGVMITNLKSGAVQVALAEEASPDVDFLHRRYHNALADEMRDIPAKRLARESAAIEVNGEKGRAAVVCPCGDEFSAVVRG